MTRLLPATPPLAIAGCAIALIACGSTSSSVSARDARAVGAARNPVAVSPQPGTPDASASTQISFLGGSGTQVSSVVVKGSRSGTHTGTLRAYSTGTGESFIPAHPFTPGEKVTVTAQVTAGPSTGRAATSFTIAHQYLPSQSEFPNNPGNASEVQHYATAPTLTPSAVRIRTHAQAGAAPGYLFFAPYQGDGTPGPMITDQNGSLVWFKPLPSGESATDFEVQQYGGQPVITWWQGRILQVGFGQGEDEIYNSEYRPVGRVRGGNGYHADLHQFHLDSNGTAWIDEFDPIQYNLASLHGKANGVLTDSIIQEIDVKTGLVMWEWHAYGHVPLSESKNPVPGSLYPWDAWHFNSISPGPSGDVLLSARNTWTLYDVDLRTGAIRWRLGGSHSSFHGSGTRFYWQHDAEWQPGGLISVFDNGSTPPKEKQSRGLVIEPNTTTHTATLRKAFTNPSRTLLAESQGNTLSLPGGDWLMGYGRLPDFTEYDAAGHVLLDGALGKNVQDFRTTLSPWTGHPQGSPSVVAKASGSTTSVSVSWNGATDVASWKVLAGASASALAPVATAPKGGFETKIAASGGPYVQVQALDAGGNVIGTSATVKA